MKAAWWLILVGLVVAAAVYTFRAAPPPNPRGPDGGCLLTGDARIVETMGDVVIQPNGHDEWTDVAVDLRGQGTGATNAGQPTGTFTLKRDIVKGLYGSPNGDVPETDGRAMDPNGDATDRRGHRCDSSRRAVSPHQVVLTHRGRPDRVAPTAAQIAAGSWPVSRLTAGCQQTK